MGENRFLLTMMVAERAKQLLAGAKPLVKTKSKDRVDIALQEIRAGKVYLKEKKVLKEENLFKRVFRFRSEEEEQELESNISSKAWKGVK